MTHRISPSTRRSTVAALALGAALALPAAASAHSSVFTSTTKTATGTPPTLIDGPVHYLVANHGHTVVLRESNGRANGGTLNYKVLPSAWRATQTKAALLKTATGAQPHATCEGLPALDQAAVLAWQEADPFFAYVPWQSAAAGIGDEESVAHWIAVVKARTGVDLSGLTTEQAQAACIGKGGTYVAADAVQTTGAALASGDIALVADPLKAQIATYKEQLDAAKSGGGAAVAAAQADAKAAREATAKAEAALKASATPLTVRVVSGAITGKNAAKGSLVVEVSGPPAKTVGLLAAATPASKGKKGKKALATLVATDEVALDAAGKATVTLKPRKAARAALAAKKAPSVDVSVVFSESAVATVAPSAKAGK